MFIASYLFSFILLFSFFDVVATISITIIIWLVLLFGGFDILQLFLFMFVI